MKLQDFKKTLNKPYFTVEDIRLRGLLVPSSQLSLWRKNGHLVSLKRGIYFFSGERERIDSLRMAQVLYEPSYVSNEYALRQYGFIPEMVYAYTSVTTKANRKFTNDLGTFLYRHVQPSLFFGYRMLRTENGEKYLLAEPEKALLDYCYLNLGRLNNEQDVQALRINEVEVSEKVDKQKFLTYRKVYGIRKLNYITDMLHIC